MPKRRETIYAALFVALLLLLWLGISLLPGPARKALQHQAGASYTLTETDVATTVYSLADGWETWPGQLYTPAQLATADAPLPHGEQDFSALPYATHRLTLRLAPGITYGITGRSSDYAMRLFLNGEEVLTVGSPATSAGENTPRVQPVVVYFTPQSETVELVVQASNHVHGRSGSKAPALSIGTAPNIAALERNANLKTGILFGGLLMAFLYYLAAFLLNRRQRASLLFALLCLALALLYVEGFATLFAGYNWYVLYRLSYAVTLSATVLLVLLVNTLFPGAVPRLLLRGYVCFCVVYLLVALLAPTLFVTRLLGVFWAVTVAVVAWCLVGMALTLRQKQRKNTLAVLGAGLFALFVLLDLLHRLGIGPAWFTKGPMVVDATLGMVVFVGFYALVLAIDQAEGNARLEHAQRELAKAEANYQKLLEEQDSVQAPHDVLAAYGLTARQTEIALFLLDGKSREEIAGLLGVEIGTVNYHCHHLYKKTGVHSAVELINLVAKNRGNAKKYST